MTTVSSRSDKLLENGTKVRVRQTAYALGLKDSVRKGGEAVVTNSFIDGVGNLVYCVEMIKTGKKRMVHRKDLIIHHKRRKATYEEASREADGRRCNASGASST